AVARGGAVSPLFWLFKDKQPSKVPVVGEGILASLAGGGMAMRCAVRFVALGLTLALVLPLWAQSYGTAKRYEKDEPNGKLQKTGKLTGRLVSVDSSLKTLKVEAKWVAAVQNADVKRTIESLKQQYANTTDAGTKIRIAQEVRKNEAKLYTLQEKKQNFDFQAVDEVRVRWKNP